MKSFVAETEEEPNGCVHYSLHKSRFYQVEGQSYCLKIKEQFVKVKVFCNTTISYQIHLSTKLSSIHLYHDNERIKFS